MITRRLLPALLTVPVMLATASVSSQAQPATTTPSAYVVIAAQYAANARGDIDGMLSLLAPNVRWTEMEGFVYRGTFIGPQAILDNVVKRVGADWETYTFTLERLIDGGDTVVGIGTYSGTYRKTGKSMTARVAHVWQVKDGKITQFEQFADTLLVDRATR